MALIIIATFQPEGFYTKQIENGNVPYAYVKSTIRSNHKNMFEAETDRRLQQNVKVFTCIVGKFSFLIKSAAKNKKKFN